MEPSSTGITMPSAAKIEISPNDHVLVDECLDIEISGLRRRQNVTVTLEVTEEKKTFESCCCFSADDDGVIDLGKQPSLSGTYTGVSPMGIFWSMVSAPGHKSIRLVKRTVDTPLVCHMKVFEGHSTSSKIRNIKPKLLAQITIERWYKGRGVTRHKVKTGRLRGALYLPQGKGPFQGVVEMCGGVGGLVETKSALLASHGFASLALAYFAYDDLPNHFKDTNLDYFIDAVDWLASHPMVYSDGVGVMGHCKGGELAIQMSVYSPKVKCVVNICGTPFLRVFGSTHRGQRIPAPQEKTTEYLYENNGYSSSAEDCHYTKDHMAQAWRHDAKILTIVAGDDKNNLTMTTMAAFKDVFPPDKLANLVVVVYPGAGHILEPPYTQHCKQSYDRNSKLVLNWGGEPQAHAEAQELAWKRSLAFLKDHIPRTGTVVEVVSYSKL